MTDLKKTSALKDVPTTISDSACPPESQPHLVATNGAQIMDEVRRKFINKMMTAWDLYAAEQREKFYKLWSSDENALKEEVDLE